MSPAHPLRSVPDDELLRGLRQLLGQSRRLESDLLAHIAEVDERRLYAREASPSMFAYCTEVLHLSEHEAYLRITVARASREHPVLLEWLRNGRLHLSGIAKLLPHLTRENHEALLARAAHRSKRQIEQLIAELEPRPDAPARVRKLPPPHGPTPVGAAPGAIPLAPLAASPSGPEPRAEGDLGPDRAVRAATLTPPARPPVVEPLAPARYRIQFTAGAELRDKLERLQALVPGADLAEVIDQAVTEKLERLEARRFARVKTPRKSLEQTDTTPSSRYIPAAVRRAVHERDGGRCTYTDEQGRRCTARKDLEFHHHGRPYGRGGDHSIQTVRLACRSHNLALAERDYGREVMDRYRRSGPRSDPSIREDATPARSHNGTIDKPEPRPVRSARRSLDMAASQGSSLSR